MPQLRTSILPHSHPTSFRVCLSKVQASVGLTAILLHELRRPEEAQTRPFPHRHERDRSHRRAQASAKELMCNEVDLRRAILQVLPILLTRSHHAQNQILQAPGESLPKRLQSKECQGRFQDEFDKLRPPAPSIHDLSTATRPSPK